MSSRVSVIKNIIFKFSPFLLFLTMFKWAGALHYSLLSPLGEQVFPIAFVGLLVGGSAFLQFLFDIPAGYLLDKYGYRKLLAVTVFLFIIACLFLTFGLTKESFLLSLGMSTFGWLFFSSGTNAYIMGQSTQNTVGRFLSAREVFCSIGVVLASATIAFVVHLDASWIGLILTSIFIIAFIFILLSPSDHRNPLQKIQPMPRHRLLKANLLKESYQTIIRLKPASFMLIFSAFCASTFYGIVWFVVPLLIAHSAHGTLLGFGLGVFDFSVVILGFILGKIVDSYSKRLLVLLGLFIFALSSILLGISFGPLFLFFGFFATTGDELSGLSLWAWLYSIDKNHEHYGLISGTISLFEDFGWTVGPIVAGLFYQYLGPSWTIALGGVPILCNLILAFFITRKIPKEMSLHPFKLHRRRYKH